MVIAVMESVTAVAGSLLVFLSGWPRDLGSMRLPFQFPQGRRLEIICD